MEVNMKVLDDRAKQIHTKGDAPFDFECEKKSTAGSVSQRACVFCGSRVVLYPIADAVHLIHGPIGCAAYTWDIRGALSSGPELHRLSFSTDLREEDVIFGGEKKLYAALTRLITQYGPRAAFVYSTCIVGIIGDDVDAVCRRVQEEQGIPVIPVDSEGFRGTKKDGYRAACEAIFKIAGTGSTVGIPEHSINILGEFNLAGEAWIIKDYYRRMGIEVVSTLTGDGRIDDIRRCHGASLNVVQCSGSMTYLAKMMEREYGIPYVRISYFGIEDMAEALYSVARHFSGEPAFMERAQNIVKEEVGRIYPELKKYREDLKGRRAAIYVGGAFKAFSLIKQLSYLGIDVAMVGSQTGNSEDYKMLRELCSDGTVIVDDSNPVEMSGIILDKDIDLFIGGVKERPMAYKLGVAFCDHNHERKIALAGFEGMLNFSREIHSSIMSPVWRFAPRKTAAAKGRRIS
jgi:nitrogenase molybdenum-cofactor synthesis protein NifE